MREMARAGRQAGTPRRGGEGGGGGGGGGPRAGVVEPNPLGRPPPLPQPLRELEQHQWPPGASTASAATTRSILMKREPLTSTVAAPRAAVAISSIEWRCVSASPSALTPPRPPP